MDFTNFVQETSQCTNSIDLHKLLLRAVAKLGFERSIYSYLTPHASIGRPACHGIVHNYPDDWLQHYRSQGYQSIDPVIKHIFNAPTAFSWEEMVKITKLNRQEKKIMREAEYAGLCVGIGIPLHGVHQEVAAICLATSDEQLELSKPILALAQAYGHQFHATYIAITETEKRDCVQLTVREKEVLSWFAKGKSLEEAGKILGISSETVRSHQKAIYKKLGVNQRTLAVVTAVRNGLIHPYHIDL